jgi:hypothetical protein
MELLTGNARLSGFYGASGFHLDIYCFAIGAEMKIAGSALWLESA